MEKGSGSSEADGLKFGKKIYFEDVGNSNNNSGSSSSSSSSSSMAIAMAMGAEGPPPPATNKGKGVLQQQHQQQRAPRCQVEGCRADLSGVKAYYCRHKVCGVHSKSPKVVVNGIEQRFCQQCSRFHQLNEFDQCKRSCRRRLAGHNERRRKPPPGPLPFGYGRLSPFHEDTNRYRSFLMDFTYPRPSATARDPWPTVRGNFNAPQPYMQPEPPYGEHELSSSGCLAGVTDSSCALSLLSNQPWGGNASPRNRGPAPPGPTGQHVTVTNSYMANNWNGGSHEIEYGHFDHGQEQFSGELELALQGNGQCPDRVPRSNYDHSGRVMHWSL